MRCRSGAVPAGAAGRASAAASSPTVSPDARPAVTAAGSGRFGYGKGDDGVGALQYNLLAPQLGTAAGGSQTLVLKVRDALVREA